MKFSNENINSLIAFRVRSFPYAFLVERMLNHFTRYIHSKSLEYENIDDLSLLPRVGGSACKWNANCK